MTRLLLCAGEASGDRLAADLLHTLRGRRSDLEVHGLAGPRLRRAGVDAVARAEEVTGVGLVEALSAAGRAWRVLRALDREMARWRPDLVITVDSPDLLLRVGRRARGRGLPVVHVVSPQVWAWRPGRVHAVARSADAVLCLFPMEPALYRHTAARAVLIGHPALDRITPLPARPEEPVLALAPGSRPSEIHALWPVFREVALQVGARVPGCRTTVLRAPTVDPRWVDDLPSEPCEDVGDLRASVALAASGTVTLELAARGIPMVVAYRVHPLTWQVGRRLVTGVRHLALPNVLAGRGLVPEHLQRLDPRRIADDLVHLLGDGGADQRAALQGVVGSLGGAGALERAADEVERWLP